MNTFRPLHSENKTDTPILMQKFTYLLALDDSRLRVGCVRTLRTRRHQTAPTRPRYRDIETLKQTISTIYEDVSTN